MYNIYLSIPLSRCISLHPLYIYVILYLKESSESDNDIIIGLSSIYLLMHLLTLYRLAH